MHYLVSAHVVIGYFNSRQSLDSHFPLSTCTAPAPYASATEVAEGDDVYGSYCCS